MNNDEWLQQNHPDFTKQQINRFKELMQKYYGYELAINPASANIERCRKLAAIGAKK